MGKRGTERDTYMQAWYDELESKSCNGDNFWILYDHTYTDYDQFGIYYPEDTTTVNIIMEHSDYVSKKSQQEMPEFTTIALPAAAILGLFLFFNYRKRGKK